MILFKSPISCGVYELGHMGYWHEDRNLTDREPGRYGRPLGSHNFASVEEEMLDFLKQFRHEDWPFLMFSDVEKKPWVDSLLALIKENGLGEVMATPSLTNPNHPNRAEGIVVYVWMPDWKALAVWKNKQKETKHEPDRAPEALADTPDENREEVCDRVSVWRSEEAIFGRPANPNFPSSADYARGWRELAPHHPQQRLRRGQPRPDGSS